MSPSLRHDAACYGAGMAIAHNQREALRMLAGSPNGATESMMLAHGFGIGLGHDLPSKERLVVSMNTRSSVDDLEIVDLKRRKLQIIDEIERLRREVDKS